MQRVNSFFSTVGSWTPGHRLGRLAFYALAIATIGAEFYFSLFLGSAPIYVGTLLLLAIVLLWLLQWDRPTWIRILLAIAMLFACLVNLRHTGIIPLVEQASPGTLTILCGTTMIALVLFFSWKTVGPPLPIVAAGALLYGLAGNHLSGVFSHPPIDYPQLIAELYFGENGIFGPPLYITVTLLFFILLFGAAFAVFGGGSVISAAVVRLLGRTRGASAKVSVVLSYFFGMFTGSGISNAGLSGAITIPMMLRAKYPPALAGAIEASSSIGAQLVPPVMGAAVFIMAANLGIEYGKIAVAILPVAVLYYVSLFAKVDLDAMAHGYGGLAEQDHEAVAQGVEQKHAWLAVVPLIELTIELIVIQHSAIRSVLTAIVTLIVCRLVMDALNRQLGWDIWLKAVSEGVLVAVPVVSAVACVGIIAGIMDVTGLGLRISMILIALSGGNVFLLLVLTMIAALVLGCGVPTLPNYIIVSTLAVPALAEVGMPPLAAHLFVFFFGVLADITPPVALAAFVTSSIAGSQYFPTGVLAFRLGMAAYVLPFVMWQYPAVLIGLGNTSDTLEAVLRATLIVVGLVLAMEGRTWTQVTPLQLWRRALIVMAVAAFWFHGWLAVGIGVLLLVLAHLRGRRSASA